MPTISEYFVRILEVAREMGLRKVGSASLDGTKVKANTDYCKECGIEPLISLACMAFNLKIMHMMQTS